MMYSPKNKNGKPMPSLMPDSADNKYRILGGTCFSANRPLTTELDKTGSVGVTQAAKTMASTKSKSGINPQIKRAEVSHIKIMRGTIIMKSERLSLTMYDLKKGWLGEEKEEGGKRSEGGRGGGGERRVSSRVPISSFAFF